EPAGKFRTNGLEIITQLLNSEINNITVGAGYRAHKQYDIRYWANFNTTSNVPPPIPLSGGYQEVSSWGNWASEPDYHENDWSLYGQDDLAISEKMSVIAGLRYDKYEQFGGVFNPRAGLTYMASDSTALKLLYGRAFRAPSYVERFTMNNPAYVGTPDLDPETVDTIESSVNYILQNFSIELGIYNSKYKDLIVLGEKPSVTEPAPYINKDKATSNGTELTVRNKIFDTLSLMLNFSCQSIKNDSTNENFPGISKHQGNVELEWKVFNTTFLNTHYYVCCDRERASNDPRGPLEGYELVNISLLSKNIGLNGLDLQISVNNLFDTEYYDPAPVYTIYNDFPRPRINTMVELKYSF
ncbi:MAG: TonB-dependent receptor protein, partial [uncultured bacterium]